MSPHGGAQVPVEKTHKPPGQSLWLSQPWVVVVVVAVVVLPLPPWPLPSTTVVPPHAHSAHKKSWALMHRTVRSLVAVGKHDAWCAVGG
jgi:hypothetical protein